MGRAATGAAAVELCAVDVPNDANEVAIVVLLLFPLLLLLLTLLAYFMLSLSTIFFSF